MEIILFFFVDKRGKYVSKNKNCEDFNYVKFRGGLFEIYIYGIFIDFCLDDGKFLNKRYI